MVVARKDNLLLFIHTCDIQSADMFSVCFWVFVRVRISSPKVKLAASHFALQFIGVQGRESYIFVNFALPEAKIETMGQRADHAHRDRNITVKKRRRKRHARDAPFVKSRGVWT